VSPKPQKAAKKGKTSAANGVSDILRLEKLAELMSRHEVAEIEWEKDGEKIRLKTAAAFAASGQAQVVSYAPAPAASAKPASSGGGSAATSAATAQEAAPSKGKQVVSPFVGTFYRSPKPDAEHYVRDGQAVKRGDVLCIIEAMKLMNEIEAEFAGKVVACLVENGQPVEFGEPLFLIEPA
jgi:acetyl-CoA carboxylase biotin carboxyl carrier protein